MGRPASKPSCGTGTSLDHFFKSSEIVTAMTLGDEPREMAVGFLYNQNMLQDGDVIPQ